MIIDLEKLSEMKYQLTQLGVVVSDLSSKNDEYFKGLQSSTERLTELINGVIDPKELEKASKHADAIASQFDRVDDLISTMSDSYPTFDNFSGSVDILSDKFNNLSSDLKDRGGSEKVSGPSALKKGAKKKKGPVANYFSKELSRVSGQLGGLLSKLKVPVIGGALAGLIGIIAFGTAERQRLQAESGEVSDILVTAADSHLKKLKDKATKWASGFQETLQQFYGVSRQEIQAIISEFSTGGTRIGEWMKRADKEMGLVGTNLASWSLGLDKLLNVAGGTTAKQMVDYQHRYGMSLKESKEMLDDVMVGGLVSGLGYSKYLSNVKEAALETEKLGFSIASTAEFMGTMQSHMDGLKVPSKLGASVVLKGTKGIAAGVSSMSEGWTRAISERLGYGTGAEGIVRFKESWMKLQANKTKPEAYRREVEKITAAILDMFGGDIYSAKYLMANELGMGAEGAYLAMEAYQKSLEAKDPSKTEEERKKASEAAEHYYKSLKKSLESEASKKKQWELHMNKWMKHISRIGMGLMGIVSNALGKLILFFRLSPEYASSYFRKDGRSIRSGLENMIDKQIGGAQKYHDMVLEGFKGLGSAGKELLGDAFGKSIDSLKLAATANVPESDIYGGTTKGREDLRSQFSGGTPVDINAPSSVQVVTLTGSGPSAAGVYSPEYMEAKEQAEKYPYSPGAKAFETSWLGERPLQIVSYGVTESGDIKMALTGECPRCALPFDSGFDKLEYEESWEESGPGIDIFGVNSGKSGRINLDRADSLDKLIDLSTSGSRRKALNKAGLSGATLDPNLKGVLRDISSMYPGRTIRVNNTLRAPKKEGRRGPHSSGKALDLSVSGVPKKELFKSLREKGYGVKKGGLGYYPGDPFIHVDVGRPRTWVEGVDKSDVNQYIEREFYSTKNQESGYFYGE